RGVRVLRDPFDIVWIEVGAPQDDEVLDAPRHEEFAVLDDAKVARPEIGSPIGLSGNPGTERFLGRVRPLPVSFGDGGPSHPYFSDLVRCAARQGLRIDDGNGYVRQSLAAARHHTAALRAVPQETRLAALQGRNVEGAQD